MRPVPLTFIDGFGEQEATREIDVNDITERVSCDLFEWLSPLSANAARHIDQHVEGPGGVDQRIDRRRLGHINLVRFDITAAGVSADEIKHPINQQIDRDHAPTPSCKRARDGMANATGGTSNQYAFALEFDQHDDLNADPCAPSPGATGSPTMIRLQPPRGTRHVRSAIESDL